MLDSLIRTRYGMGCGLWVVGERV